MIKYRWGGVGWDNNVHVPVYTHNDDDDGPAAEEKGLETCVKLDIHTQATEMP